MVSLNAVKVINCCLILLTREDFSGCVGDFLIQVGAIFSDSQFGSFGPLPFSRAELSLLINTLMLGETRLDFKMF